MRRPISQFKKGKKDLNRHLIKIIYDGKEAHEKNAQYSQLLGK